MSKVTEHVLPEILLMVGSLSHHLQGFISQVVQDFFSSLQKNSVMIFGGKLRWLEPLGTLLSGHMVSQKWHRHVQALEMGRRDQVVSSRSRDPLLGNKNSDHGGSAINNDVRKLNFSQSLVDLP